jgi:hypothetical protein
MRNVAASKYAQIKLEAQRRGVDTGTLIRCWIMEAFLRRFSMSPFRERYLLKGSHLINVWEQRWSRYPRDVDLESASELAPAPAYDVVSEVFAASTQPLDGVDFELASIAVRPVYGPGVEGERLSIQSRFHSARVPLQVDFSYGHPMRTQAEAHYYPSLISQLHPIPLLCSSPETAIAERLAYLVEFGVQASRSSDLFDLWLVAGRYHVRARPLLEAISKTFACRYARQALVSFGADWCSVLDGMVSDRQHQIAWEHWRRRSGLRDVPSLPHAVDRVRSFSVPVLRAACSAAQFDAEWIPGFGWENVAEATSRPAHRIGSTKRLLLAVRDVPEKRPEVGASGLDRFP